MNLSLEAMNKSRKEGKYCDFTIVVEGRKYPVHRLVLGSSSEYFRLLFDAEMREKEQQFSEERDVTAIGVERAIACMYGEELDLDKETVAEVLNVCHRWHLSAAVKTCENFLMKNLDDNICILAKNLAKLYDMSDLATKCDNFVLRHLKLFTSMEKISCFDMDAVSAILAASRTVESVSPAALWIFSMAWIGLQESGSSVCRILRNFPKQKFQHIMLDDTIWNGSHLARCKGCSDHFKKMALKLIQLQHITTSSCVFMKCLAKRFEDERVEKMADDFIVEHHGEVFTHAKFIDVEEDDLLKYVDKIDERCSGEEFSALINWLRYNPEREKVFPKLFSRVSRVLSHRRLFHDNVLNMRRPWNFFRSFFSRNEETSWLVQTKDCFFLKRLAKKYRCGDALQVLNKFITEKYHEISKTKEFLQLSMEEVKEYIPYGNEKPEEIQWEAITSWLNHDLEERRQHFPELMRLLEIAKFSTGFLENTVLKSEFVQDSESCLLRIMLTRMITLEKENSKLKERLQKSESDFSKLAERVQKLENKK